MPPATIVLAQLFMHRFLLELEDQELQSSFEGLSDQQAPEYRVWRRMTHVSLEAARAWMSSIRRGTGGQAPVDLDAVLNSQSLRTKRSRPLPRFPVREEMARAFLGEDDPADDSGEKNEK